MKTITMQDILNYKSTTVRNALFKQEIQKINLYYKWVAEHDLIIL